MHHSSSRELLNSALIAAFCAYVAPDSSGSSKSGNSFRSASEYLGSSSDPKITRISLVFLTLRLAMASRISRLERIALNLKQLLQTEFSQTDQPRKLLFFERLSLGGALHLHIPQRIGHHKVHVHSRARVFFVIQIEQFLPADDADAHRGDHFAHRIAAQHSSAFHPRYRVAQRDARSGNRGGARSAIGLQNVTIQRDGALADRR